MDVEKYFYGISFRPVEMEKGFYVLEARVSTGDEMIVRVISKNRAEYLGNMDWRKLWGLKTSAAKGHHRLQSFFPGDEFCRDKTLTLDHADHQKSVYMSNIHPYVITIPHIENFDGQYASEERITLVEAIGSPQFEVRRFG